MVEAEFRSPKAVQTSHTHALRDNSQNGIAAETSYQNTIQNSTLHQAVSHGSMVDSKERSASGSKGFFPHDHPTFTCSKPRLLLSSAAL